MLGRGVRSRTLGSIRSFEKVPSDTDDVEPRSYSAFKVSPLLQTVTGLGGPSYHTFENPNPAGVAEP